jgi:VWFA-related protein
MHSIKVGFGTILLSLLLAGGASAQYIPKPKNPDTGPQTNSDEFPNPVNKTPTPSSAESDNPLETFKVDVNVVNLLFNVKDKHGSLMPNLSKDDFQIAEDGKPQTIKYFKSETNLPLTLGILIDTSLSQDAVLPMEKQVGAEFLEQVLRDKDMAFVISFDVNVDLQQDFTSSKKLLRAGMEGTHINASMGGGPGIGGGPFPTTRPRGTLLYDAVFLAANEKLSREVGRKAMILLTDGEDQGSQLTLRDALTAAQKSDAIIYTLLISDSHVAFGNGEHDMKKLCEETGGRVIRVGNKIEKLRDAFNQISAELRSQYSLGYTPTNNKRDGSFREIDIKSKEGYKIQARKGYYAPLQ